MAVGGEPVVGAVALPGHGPGALDRPAPGAGALRRRRAAASVVSRSRPPDVAYDVAEALGAVMVPLGSAGAGIAPVILGAAEIYVHAGGQYEWDSCAPAAVALASGLHASRLDGSPLRYGLPDAWLPDLVVCRRSTRQPCSRSPRAATVPNGERHGRPTRLSGPPCDPGPTVGAIATTRLRGDGVVEPNSS